MVRPKSSASLSSAYSGVTIITSRSSTHTHITHHANVYSYPAGSGLMTFIVYIFDIYTSFFPSGRPVGERCLMKVAMFLSPSILLSSVLERNKETTGQA